MKCRYPDVFAAALINSQPMGFYAPAQIVRDAQEHGVEVRPVDVNHSDWDCDAGTGDAGQGPPARPPCRDGRRSPRRPCAAARLSPDQRIFRGRRPRHRSAAAAPASIRSATCGCAAGSSPRRWSGWREADAFRSLGLDRRDGAVGGAGAAPRRRQGRPAAVRHVRIRRRSNPTSTCRRCGWASRWSRIIAACTCR